MRTNPFDVRDPPSPGAPPPVARVHQDARNPEKSDAFDTVDKISMWRVPRDEISVLSFVHGKEGRPCGSFSSRWKRRILFRVETGVGGRNDTRLEEGKHGKCRKELVRKYTLSMRKHGKRKHPEGIMGDLETMESLGIVLGREEYNVALGALADAKDVDRCQHLFQTMLKKKEVGVDEHSCSTLVRCLGKSGDLDAAFELVDELETRRIFEHPRCFQSPSIIGQINLMSPRKVLDALLDACAEQGELKRAKAVMRRMRSRMLGGFHGWKRREFNLLIKAASRSPDPSSAFLAAAEMRSHGIAPDAFTYNTLLYAVSKGAGGYREGRAILVEMRSRAVLTKNNKLFPDALSYTSLICCLLKDHSVEGRFETLVQLEEEMSVDSKRRSDPVARAAVIDACLELGKRDAGLAYLNMYVDRGEKVRAHAYLALMRAFALNADVGVVCQLRERMFREAHGRIHKPQIEEADRLVEEITLINAREH